MDISSWISSNCKFAGLSGEWWIDDLGYAEYADGDVGDYNHAMLAMGSILGVDLESAEEDILPFEAFSPEQIQWLRDNGAEEDGIEALKDGADPRDIAIEKLGWIRVAGDNATCRVFDQEAFDRLADFACNELSEMGLSEAGFGQESIYVEQVSDHSTWDIPYSLLCRPGANVDAVKHLVSGVGQFRSMAEWVARTCKFAERQFECPDFGSSGKSIKAELLQAELLRLPKKD